MKAKELMIGDWVQGFLPNTYSRVEAIPNEYRLGIITSGGHYIEAAPDDFQPIPLTPEILEKNGFENNPFDKRVWNWENARYHILLAQTRLHMSERTKNKILRYDITRLPKYVHELQHALRLCGIEKEIIL